MAEEKIDPAIIKQLDASVNKRIIVKNERDGQKFQSSYTYILDSRFKPLAILYLPYVQDDSLLNRDLHDFLVKMAEVYLFMLLIAIILSFFLSKYITKSLKIISEKSTRRDWISETRRSSSATRQKRSIPSFRPITA